MTAARVVIAEIDSLRETSAKKEGDEVPTGAGRRAREL
jgi:hypothetical protein